MILMGREWGSSTSHGKDLRDVTYSNYFPVGMSGNFPIKANSTVEQYEHIQAISVGVGTTYSLSLNQKDCGDYAVGGRLTANF